jgi:hypothetical protein
MGKKKERRTDMGKRIDFVEKRFKTLRDKNLQTALAHRIKEDFPRLGGPRIVDLCVEMILDELDKHFVNKDFVKHGQVLWMGIAIDSPPRRHQKISDMHLIPIILDLSVPQDVTNRIKRLTASERLSIKAVRLCHQAYEQGALLSNCDLAELLTTCDDSKIARALIRHESETGTFVPRRATVHDVGTGLTHKGIICWKRYAEGKSPDQVARETYHTLESVDRYLADYDRVRHCKLQGFTPEQTAFTLNHSVGLINQYLAIDLELGALNA